MTRHDPQARRAAILDAAADLVVESGPERLTHRRVADRAGVPLGATTQYFASIDDLRTQALEKLADEIDSDLATVSAGLAESGGSIGTLVALLHEYLSTGRNIAADVSLMSAAAFDPDLRELALRWQNNLIDLLTAYVGAEKALALAVLADGITVHAALHGAVVSKATLHTLVAPFMAQE